MRTYITWTTSALLLTVAFMFGCGEATNNQESAPEKAMTLLRLGDVTDAQWQALASRRIFFGHQSVGRNILAGMDEVLEGHPEIRLRIVGTNDPTSVDGAAFIEANIGQNAMPDTKADAFAHALETGFGSEPDAVAMYKYCYVDMLPDADPEAFFADYVRRTEVIRARYPGLTIVHFTLPLHVNRTGLKESIKRRLGITTELALNVKRNRYNELLRARYGSSDPVFDLALLESTRADGSRAFSRYQGQNVFMLAPEWTDDGGHLNEEAQVRVAEQLLVFLAQLPRTTGSKTDVSDATRVGG